MSKISFNMVFWHDGKTNSSRIRNVSYTWSELKKLVDYLTSNEIDAICNLYDFSPEKVLEESIWHPFPLAEFRKAEKLNIVLNENQHHEFFCMVDCDCFFDPLDYPKLLEQINKLEKNDIITYDLAKLGGDRSNYIIEGVFHQEKTTWSYAYSGLMENGPLRGIIGGLGGVFICTTDLMTEVGGYDENFKTWGGEDGDLLNRIMIKKKYNNIYPTRNFAPFHLDHFTDWDNKKYKN